MPTLLAVIYANTVNGTGCRTGSVGDGITADIIASDSDCIFGRDKAKLTGQGQGQSQGIGQGQGLDLSPARLQYVRAYVKCLDSQRVKFGVANGEGVGVSVRGYIYEGVQICVFTTFSRMRKVRSSIARDASAIASSTTYDKRECSRAINKV